MKLRQCRSPTLTLLSLILLTSAWVSACSSGRVAQVPTIVTAQIALGVTPVERIRDRAFSEGIDVGPLYNDHSGGISTMVFVVPVSSVTSESTYDQIAAKLHAMANAYGGSALNAVRLDVRFVSSGDPKKVLAHRYYPLASTGTP